MIHSLMMFLVPSLATTEDTLEKPAAQATRHPAEPAATRRQWPAQVRLAFGITANALGFLAMLGGSFLFLRALEVIVLQIPR